MAPIPLLLVNLFNSVQWVLGMCNEGLCFGLISFVLKKSQFMLFSLIQKCVSNEEFSEKLCNLLLKLYINPIISPSKYSSTKYNQGVRQKQVCVQKKLRFLNSLKGFLR